MQISRWVVRPGGLAEVCYIAVVREHLFLQMLQISDYWTSGFQNLRQHYDWERHKTNAVVALSPQQRVLGYTGTGVGSASSRERPAGDLAVYARNDDATRAEVLWCIKAVRSSYSAASMEGLVDVFRAMFQAVKLPVISISAIKFSYLLTEAVGLYSREMVLEESGNVYVLCFDETTNAQSNSELQIRDGLKRFWWQFIAGANYAQAAQVDTLRSSVLHSLSRWKTWKSA